MGDEELAFRVRALADRYCMPRLVCLAESILYGMLSQTTVLSFLGRVVGSGGALEDACWALLNSAGEEILTENADVISDLISQNPELAKRLILWRSGADGDPARGNGKRRRLSQRVP